MSTRFGSNGGPPGVDDDDVKGLLEDAGKRPEVPEDDLARIKSAARDAWRASVRSRRRTITQYFALAAAVVIAVVGGALWMSRPGTSVDEPLYVARFETVRGDLTVTAESGGAIVVRNGAELGAGDLVEVGDGLASLEIGQGVSLRLAANTSVRLTSTEAIDLERGAVYIDTGKKGGSIEVTTPFGVARDVGTRFQVRLDESVGVLSVSVREGEVVVRHGGEQDLVGHGSKLVVHSDGNVEGSPAPVWGDDWNWILELSPPFEMEGRTLNEYLDWVVAETGLEIRLEDSELEPVVESTLLHGSTGDLRADEAVLVVLMGAGLEGQIEEGVLVVRAGS